MTVMSEMAKMVKFPRNNHRIYAFVRLYENFNYFALNMNTKQDDKIISSAETPDVHLQKAGQQIALASQLFIYGLTPKEQKDFQSKYPYLSGIAQNGKFYNKADIRTAFNTEMDSLYNALKPAFTAMSSYRFGVLEPQYQYRLK